MKKKIVTLCVGVACLSSYAQNITDIAIRSDMSAGKIMENSGDLCTFDDSVFFHPDRIRMDHRCIQIEGEDTYIVSGAFHYFRVPKPLWRDRMMKLKNGGFNCVETYVPWNWHERRMPRNPKDMSCLDMSDLEDFLTLAEECGVYVIVRPGPYICAEWRGGGFPQWLLRKKPAQTAYGVWLQSDDPEFMRWNEHWYRAVCDVVAPHQITKRGKGEKGVILFQVENEYNRVNWFPKEMKRDYLENLTAISRKNGIDVPIVTCWTDESRNVELGLLNGAVDMVNSYPRWEIEKSFGRIVNKQLQTQPGKPLISGELQGGWYSDVSGALSWCLPGIEPVQTQNLTLYALQRGFGAVNYYMLVGGSNFDDWNGRQVTQTYDYAAAISEDGSTNERYRRFRGLNDFLKNHGVKIARANVAAVEYDSTDKDVRLALRLADNGDRYYFIRTEDRARSHFGTITADGIAFDFALEPFGSMVYYLPAGSAKGEWYPKLPEPVARPSVKADTVRISPRRMAAYPKKWTKIGNGEFLDSHGIYGCHPILYRTKAPRGRRIDIGYVGDRIVNGSRGDNVLMSADGLILTPVAKNDTVVSFIVPDNGKSREPARVYILHAGNGIHHHTNRAVEENWGIGVKSVVCDGKPLPLEYDCSEKTAGESASLGGTTSNSNDAESTVLLNWTVYEFKMPQTPQGIRYPYYLDLTQKGDGYIYLNGHCLGRCYQDSPQKSYYLPECWLNFGGDNIVAVSLYPLDRHAEVIHAAVVPVTSKAETTACD